MNQAWEWGRGLSGLVDRDVHQLSEFPGGQDRTEGILKRYIQAYDIILFFKTKKYVYVIFIRQIVESKTQDLLLVAGDGQETPWWFWAKWDEGPGGRGEQSWSGVGMSSSCPSLSPGFRTWIVTL